MMDSNIISSLEDRLLTIARIRREFYQHRLEAETLAKEVLSSNLIVTTTYQRFKKSPCSPSCKEQSICDTCLGPQSLEEQ